MDSIKSFMNKAKEDKTLMAKLEALGEKAGEKDFMDLAAEYGFTIADADIKKYQTELSKKYASNGELNEDELEQVAGGWPTENRHYKDVCSQYKEAHYNCVGFLSIVNCDHYRKIELKSLPGSKKDRYNIKCVMGYFDYIKETERSGGSLPPI